MRHVYYVLTMLCHTCHTCHTCHVCACSLCLLLIILTMRTALQHSHAMLNMLSTSAMLHRGQAIEVERVPNCTPVHVEPAAAVLHVCVGGVVGRHCESRWQNEMAKLGGVKRLHLNLCRATQLYSKAFRPLRASAFREVSPRRHGVEPPRERECTLLTICT